MDLEQWFSAALEMDPPLPLRKKPGPNSWKILNFYNLCREKMVHPEPLDSTEYQSMATQKHKFNDKSNQAVDGNTREANIPYLSSYFVLFCLFKTSKGPQSTT